MLCLKGLTENNNSEFKKCEERWTKTEYLKDIEGYKRSAIAVLLENQRLINECTTNDDQFSEIKGKLIALVHEVYSKLMIWDLISIQPLLGPTGLAFYTRLRDNTVVMDSDTIIAKTRRLKRSVCSDFGVKDVARDLVYEIETEVLTDLANNCATVSCLNLSNYTNDKGTRLSEKVDEVFDLQYRNFGYKPSWLVVNDDLHKYCSFKDKGITVYPHRGVNGVLMGYRGESYMDSGYVLSPYVPFTYTYLYDDVHGLLVRYGKKLFVNGSQYYSKIEIIDNKKE